MSDTKNKLAPWKLSYATEYKTRVSLGDVATIAIARIGDGISVAEAEANARLIAAAPTMLNALKEAQSVAWVHNAAITDDIEALRAIALDFSKWWNDTALPAIFSATEE